MTESDRLSARNKENLRSLCNGTGNLDASLKQMSEILYKYYGRKVIILIDEYDAPLQKAYENDYYDDMVRLIRQIFGYALKSNDSLFFSVLTGCMRISKESIFSDLNNPVIHSVSDEPFDEWFGFTDHEVREMLESYGLEQFYETTREWYDGYRFGGQNVYCPWDVINWCSQLINTSDRIPQNFWVNSGGTDIIREFAEKADSVTRNEIGELMERRSVRKTLTFDISYKDMHEEPENVWSLLYTAGYLTHKKRYEDGSYELCIPNREVESIFVSKVNTWFKSKVLSDEEGIESFFAAFASGDPEGMENFLNAELSQSISYHDGGSFKDKETFYHGILLGMLSRRTGWDIKSNREAGNGRADILAYNVLEKEGYVIEVKYSGKESDLDDDAKKALAQISLKSYGSYFDTSTVKKVWSYGIAFYKKQCRVLLSKN